MGADTVFISYSHDSPEHSGRVLAFSNKLRALGVDVELDQYHTRPPEGWPRWCEIQLRPENSKFVLLICTRSYRNRVENQVPADEGRGVYWEGGIINQYIYRDKASDRFIPVLVADESSESVPIRLQGFTEFRIKAFDLSDSAFEALYRELTGQPAVVKPTLGEKVVLAKKAPDAPQIAAALPEKLALTTFAASPPPVQVSRAGSNAWVKGGMGVLALSAIAGLAILSFSPSHHPPPPNKISSPSVGPTGPLQTPTAAPSGSPRAKSPAASKVIAIWRVGSPHDGKAPDTSMDPQFASLVQNFGYKTTITALPAKDFLDRFKDAVASHEEPDIVAIDNYGLLTGIDTAIGRFEGLLNEPGMKERVTFAYRSLRALEGPSGGWELLVSGSPNAEAARALVLRDPECDPGWMTGMGPGELNQMAPEAASAYLRNDRLDLTRVSDSERFDRGPATTWPQPLEVTGITQCSYWGNNRVRFGVLVLRFETPTTIGNTPVLIILRKDNQQWRLLAATEDRFTLDHFPAQLHILSFHDTSSASLGRAMPAQLLSPDAGESPQPTAGQRFGDYVWRPSTSPDVAAEIAEFDSSYWCRLFLRKRNGPPPAKDSVSAGQLYSGALVWWRIWSITNSGDVVFSERR